MNYKKVGNDKSNKTLVFVHGSGCNSKIFSEIVKYLEDYRCILVDLPGHGESKNMELCNTIESYVDSLEKLLREELSVYENIVLVGYSMGGAITLGAGLRNIPSVKGIITLSSGARFDSLNKKFMAKIHENKVDKFYIMRCVGNYFNPLTYKHMFTLEQDNKVITNDLLACEKYDILMDIHRIYVPVQAIVAQDEILTLAEYSKKICTEVPNSQLKIYPRGRHFLVVCKAKEISHDVRKFLELTVWR